MWRRLPSQLNIFSLFCKGKIVPFPPGKCPISNAGCIGQEKDRRDVLGLRKVGLYQPHVTSCHPGSSEQARQDQHFHILQVFRASLQRPLSMASSNPTNLVSETSPAKADMEFSEDVEASRSSSKHDENTHIQHAELTDEDVCLPPRPWFAAR